MRTGGPAAELHEEQLRSLNLDRMVEALATILPSQCVTVPARARVDMRGFRHASVIDRGGHVGGLEVTIGDPTFAVSVDLPDGLDGDGLELIGSTVWHHIRRASGLRAA